MKSTRFLVPVALIASVVAAHPAVAESNGRTVSYADLDLTSPAGVAMLDRRIRGAIRQVCGRAFPRDLQSQIQVERCRAETLADVQAQRNDALAESQNHRVQLSARR